MKNFDMKHLSSKKESTKASCQECGKNYSVNSLKEHISNIHIRRSMNQANKKPPEDVIKFLTEINSEFQGPELSMVLEFLHNQKIYNNPQLLKIIIEYGNYRKIFEDFGVLPPKRNAKAR